MTAAEAASAARPTLRGDARRIAPLAWPVFVGQVAVIAFSTVDTLLIARYAATDLAAVERGLLLALGGAWQFDGAGAALRCEAGTGVWWQGRAYGGYVAPQQPGAVLVVVQLHRA